MAVENVTTANFEEKVLKSSQPVLVDFWASWCGPCRMLGPVVEQVAEEAGNVKIAKVNVDDEPDLAEQYGINAIPCLIVFKDGKPFKRSVGYIPKESVEELIHSAQ